MKWNKQIHVKSSLERKDSQWSMFIGRWQPLHDGHKAMFQQVLDEGGKVLICIRTIEPDEKNPFHAWQVYDNIVEHYKDNDNVDVMLVPDICSVEFGRGVGYDIIEHIPPTEIAEISATNIRKELGL
jgi:adenylylsulfate kinase